MTVTAGVDPPSRYSELIERIQARSGLSQAALARRAGLPRSVLNVYLQGNREPGVDAALGLAAAAGLGLDLVERRAPVDAERASRILVQVLELAEALPFQARDQIQYPRLADRLANPSATA